MVLHTQKERFDQCQEPLPVCLHKDGLCIALLPPWIIQQRAKECVRLCADCLLQPCLLSEQDAGAQNWKRLKGKNREGKNSRKPLRRKQSSTKISRISRNTLKSSKSDIVYLLRNLLKYLLRTFFFFREVFRSFCPLRFYPIALSDRSHPKTLALYSRKYYTRAVPEVQGVMKF